MEKTSCSNESCQVLEARDAMSDVKEYFQFLGRILLGIVCSLIITSIVYGILGPFALLIGLCVAIYANRRRKEFLRSHMRYVKFVGAELVLFAGAIGFYAMNIFVVALATRGRHGAVDMPPITYILILAMGLLTMWFVKRENQRGVSTLDVAKLSTTVAFTIVYCLISYTALIHSHYFSGDEIFADVDHLGVNNMSGNGINGHVTNGDEVYVHGYRRDDGTYVHSHFRTAPDGIESNNWSHEGNINPINGKHGHNH